MAAVLLVASVRPPAAVRAAGPVFWLEAPATERGELALRDAVGKTTLDARLQALRAVADAEAGTAVGGLARM
ncbi:MAG TPA: hypothetical protein VH683_01930, partial [Thermoleophilaceae bacterium]